MCLREVLCVCALVFAATTVQAQTKSHDVYLRKGDPSEPRVAVERGDALTIHVEGINATHLRCLNDKYTGSRKQVAHFLYELFEEETSVTVGVTDEMNARWRCLVFEIRGPGWTVEAFYFYVHVRGAKKFEININEIEISARAPNDSALSVDGVAQYSFEEGESVDYTCTEPYDCKLRLEFRDANGSEVFSTEKSYEWSSTSLRFRAVLVAALDGSFVDCVCAAPTNNQSFVYRTYFRMGDGPSVTNNLTVTVNGLKLVPARKQSDSTAIQYKFAVSPTDNLTITCEKDSGSSGAVELHWTPAGTDIGKVNGTSEKQTLELTMVDGSLFEDMVLRCGVSNSSEDSLPADILLVTDDSLLTHDVRIVGLSASNIPLQYSHNDSLWYSVYKYSAGETINVFCVANYAEKRTINWNFDGVDIAAPNYVWVQPKHLRFTKVIFGEWSLDARHEGAALACSSTAPHSAARVLLRQSDDLRALGSKVGRRGIGKGLLAILIVAGVGVVLGAALTLHLRDKRRKNLGKQIDVTDLQGHTHATKL